MKLFASLDTVAPSFPEKEYTPFKIFSSTSDSLLP